MPFAPINDIQAYYREYGSGVPLVFVHGNGSNHVTWCYQVAFFSRWFRVITPDLRGFGNTADPPGSPGMAAAGDDLVALLDHLQIDRAVVVGHSLGGRIVLPFAVRHADRLLALALVDTVGGISAPGPFNDQYHAARQTTPAVPPILRYLSKGFVEREPGLAQLHMGLGGLRPGLTRRASFASQVAVTLDDLQRLAHTPLLWVAGEEDAWNPQDLLEMAQQFTPGSSLVLMPDAGHSPYFEQPHAFNQVLHTFLAQHGLAPHHHD